MVDHALIRTGQSLARDARTAAREFHAAVAQPDSALVTFFCSAGYDLDELAAAMAELFEGVQVVGCTTAGELGPAGSADWSVSGVSFSARCCVAASGRIDGLQHFRTTYASSLAQSLLRRLEALEPGAGASNTFGLLLIDGLCVREEPVTRALQSGLGEITLIGGSAGDGLDFGRTFVYCDGAFRSDSAALVLVSTPLPFTTFKTQHVISTGQRLVVTGADPEHRIVTEIDGLPAADRYASLVRAEVDSLDPGCFAEQPLAVLIDGTEYVRSIQTANPDRSLTLFCAIEEGVVLRAARCGDLVEDLDRTFAGIRAEVGAPLVVIGCDCILRKLSLIQHGLRDRVEALYRANNVVGFNSYGEQYRGVHVNQTLTGIAIGEPSDA